MAINIKMGKLIILIPNYFTLISGIPLAKYGFK